MSAKFPKVFSFILLGGIILIALVYYARNNSYISDWPEEKAPTLEDWQSKYPELIKQFVVEPEPKTIPPYIHRPGIQIEQILNFPEAGWIIGFETEVISGPRNLLHHIDFINLSSPNYFCPGEETEFFFSVLKEEVSGFLPLNYGYPVTDQANINYLLMYHNPTAVIYNNVITKITFWYVPKTASANITPVRPLAVDISGTCHVLDRFTVPANRQLRKSTIGAYLVDKPVKIVAAGGHIHDFGKYIKLKLNNKNIKTFVPQIGDNGEIISMPIFYPKNLELGPGDVLDVEMFYDSFANEDLEGMARVTLYGTTE